MKHIYLALFTAVMGWVGASAQVVTTNPPIIQQSTPDIVITFHADRGNRGLMGVKPPTKVYAHTGVITSASLSSSDWKYAPTWGTNTEKYELTWVADNTWTLTIPSIDSYYGVKAGETVKQLAFVFRTANNSAEGKTESGGDILVNVLPEGFQATISSDAQGMVMDANPVTFTVNTTAPADIKLYIDNTSTTPIAQATATAELRAEHTFATPGTFQVIAVASAPDATRQVATTLTRLGEPIQRDFPGGVPQMGYTVEPNGAVTFCLAAPGKRSAVIVGSWDDYEVLNSNMMYYQDYQGQRYFWITIPGIDPTKDNIYYYLIDGTVKVGDPYARLVLDPYNDKYIKASVFPDLPAYPTEYVQNVPLAVYNPSRDAYSWQVTDFVRPAQTDLVIYELLIRDFTGSEGKALGSGTIAGVIDKLDYLQELGVNAVELLPIMEFNGNNSWGYNTNFYFAPDKAYGTPNDYRRLVDECHARGMAVILDIVFNQSDGLHPWYQMYPIADNPFYNGSAPHAYSVLNDWNQDNKLVQQQWHDCLRYWLTAYNVDGFRFDLVKGLGSNQSYDNTYYPATNTWGIPSEANTNKYNASRVIEMSELHSAMNEVSPTAYFINENLAGAKEENEMAADYEMNWANINEASCQFAMGYSSDSNTSRFYAPLDSRTWGSTVSYAESHDEERMAYKIAKWGVEGVKGDEVMATRRLGSVAAQMLMTPGAHMIWQFQEFGADQSTKSSDGSNNTSPKRVVWSYLDKPSNAGLLQSYKELIALRRENPEMFRYGVATSVKCNTSNWANGRTISLVNGDSEIYCVINPNVSGVRDIPAGFTKEPSTYKLISASSDVTPSLVGTSVTLPAGAYAIYATSDISGIGQPTSDAATSLPLVTTQPGQILVEGAFSTASVYAPDGRLILSTSSPSISVAPGLYIVRVDSRAARVLVR